MKFLKPAARNRGRKSRVFLLPLLLLASLHSQAAFSASLTVKIRQLNPDGAVQQVTCAAMQKCLLPVDIQSGATKETLTLNVNLMRGTLLAKFQTPKGFLFVGDTFFGDSVYKPIWQRVLTPGKASTEVVTLYLPAMPRPIEAPMLDVAHETALKIAHPVVATLEITRQLEP
jgi:hypothetical protein